MKELECDEPYEVAVGCPTITFELMEGSLMLPWASFVRGNLKGGRIELSFQEWRIEILGTALQEVWRLLQMQDVRGLRRSASEAGRSSPGVRIRAIKADKEPAK